MGRYAQILNSAVENIIEAEGPGALPGLTLMPALDHTAIGDVLVDGQLPPPAPEPEPDPELERQAELRAAKFTADQIITSRLQRQAAQAETFTAAEFATLAKAGLFDEWAAGAEYSAGRRVVHNGAVYGVIQAVTSQAHQPPDAAGMLAVYRPLSVDPLDGGEADGTPDSPISFVYGMDVDSGKYYSFEGTIYLARADMKPCVWNPGAAGLWQWEAANG